MEIKEQSGLRQVLAGTPLPKMCKVRQIFKRDGIEDVPAYLQKKLDDPKLRARIKPGMRVVLTGSSRQIANMSVILRKLAQFVKEQGAQPYIIPAMGSHGGATDEGQRQILEELRHHGGILRLPYLLQHGNRPGRRAPQRRRGPGGQVRP